MQRLSIQWKRHRQEKSNYQRFGEKIWEILHPFNICPGFRCCGRSSLPLIGGFLLLVHRGLVVLVASCSCGIVLSVPVAVVAAIGNAARHGVLVKVEFIFEIAEKLKAHRIQIRQVL